jgi:6-phospho-beta-glucosidase
MKKLKITNIGAGSLYTPDFALMLIDQREKLNIEEWRLMDIDSKRLSIVADYVRMLFKKVELDIRLTTTTDLEEAVKDVDYVITTIRPGGTHGRILDETVPLEFGLIGQETTPPGGLAMGLRNIPDIVEIAEQTERHAKPSAWLINLTNPAGMLTEAIYRYTNCKAVGLCNWPRSFWTKVAAAYGVERDDVFLQLVGLNHLNWARAFVKGVDVSEEVGEKFSQEMAKFYGPEIVKAKFMLPKDIRDLVGWPLIVQYCRYYYCLDEMLEDQKASTNTRSKLMINNLKGKIPDEVIERINIENVKTRAEFVELIEELTLELYEEKNTTGYDLISLTRGGEGYGAAGLEIIIAIEHNLNQVQVVDFPNLGSIPDLPNDVVVEHSCLINGAGIHPISMPGLRPHMQALVNSVKQYEILACEAAMEGDYRKALEALLAHPNFNDFDKSKAVLDALLLAHRDSLPNFNDAITKIEQGVRPY